jgi:hypothetical protein
MPRYASPDYDPMMDELPPELAAQYKAEQRKQRIAQVMSGQAMQPLQAPEVKGRFQGAISPLAGLAQLAQAYMSSKMVEGADKNIADIGRRSQEQYSAEAERIGNTPAEQVTQALLGSYSPRFRRIGEGSLKTDIDTRATQNLLKSFGQGSQPAPAVPQAPAVPMPDAPGNVREPAWNPAAAAQDPNNPRRGAGTVAPMDATRRVIIQQELANPDNQKDPAAWAALVKEAQAAGIVPGMQTVAAPAQNSGVQVTASPAPAAPATPLEEFTRRQKYSRQDAEGMMASGNKTVMMLGKSILDGYKQAEMETLIKQPGRVALATQAQGAAAERQQTGITAADARQQKALDAKTLDTAMTPEAIHNAAENYRITGNLPAMGMGGAAARVKILNRAAELATEAGDTGESAAIRQAANKANQQGLNQLTKQEQMVGAFEKNANMNADLALSMVDKAGINGVPVVSRWIQSGMKEVAGDPDVSKFHAYTETFINEYAKIMSGSMGNTAVSDAARKNAHSLLSTAMKPEQYRAVVEGLKQEMQNRMAGFAAQKAELTTSMGTSKPTGAAAAQAPAGKEETWVRDKSGKLVRQ